MKQLVCEWPLGEGEGRGALSCCSRSSCAALVSLSSTSSGEISGAGAPGLKEDEGKGEDSHFCRREAGRGQQCLPARPSELQQVPASLLGSPQPGPHAPLSQSSVQAHTSTREEHDCPRAPAAPGAGPGRRTASPGCPKGTRQASACTHQAVPRREPYAPILLTVWTPERDTPRSVMASAGGG